MQKKLINLILVLVVAALGYFFAPANKPSPDNGVSQRSTHNDQSALLQTAFAKRQSKVWATVKVKVRKTLMDDNKGSRHQRFLVNLANGQSILVAHNIDLAPRAPIRAGARIWIKGRYEWSDKGGVLHWTHHNPKGGRGGWIEVDGKRYD